MTDIRILENFYTNPDYVINMLSGEYPIFGCGTGNRSISLQEINPQLYNELHVSLCAIHGIDPSKHHMTSFFMEHTYDQNSPYNKGWTHIDGKDPSVCRMTVEEYKLVVCGQIFLTKQPDPETGLYLCSLKPTVKWTQQDLIDKTINNYTIPKENLDAGLITREQYQKEYDLYHENFDITCEVKHTYNRMVSWKAGTLHGTKQQTSNMMLKRLTQYFFIQKI